LRWKRDEREKGTGQFSEGPETAARATGTVKKTKGKTNQDGDLSGMEDSDTDE
jgi:hypothetical protein